MEPIRANGGGGGAGDSDSPLISSWTPAMLVLRAECLLVGAKKAADAGDEVTAMQFVAEALEAIQQARAAEERARAQ